MSTQKQGGVLCCCSVLRDEIEKIRRDQWPDWTARYLSSRLHMRPEELASELGSLIEEEIRAENRVVLVYGDCCHAMAGFERIPGVTRTKGLHCGELLMGKAAFRQLIKDGAFFLLPEWTRRWEEIFTTDLGLNQKNATSLMQDMHTKITYLDTGVIPVPFDAIKACARYCGLPCEVLSVSPDRLRTTIQEAIDRPVPDKS